MKTFLLKSAFVRLRLAALALAASLALVSCGREESVSITLLTEPREGQVISDDFIELVEGQAIGVRVVAVQNDEPEESWTVEVSAENPNVIGFFPGIQENVFVLSGAAPGSTRLRFLLDGRYEVYVDSEVVPREDFEPTVPEPNLGGAGGAN